MAKKIFTQDPEKYIVALAAALKEMPEFVAPEWVAYVKSGTSRKRPPVEEDFWFTRSASILRQLYIRGVVGVGKLRNRYGSRKDRGGKPDEFRKASGKIIRVILQQAEAAGLVEKLNRMQHGRRLTAKGRELLDSIDAPAAESLNLEEITTNTVVTEDVQADVEVPAESETAEEVEAVEENTDVEEVKEAASPDVPQDLGGKE
jgi:small subunit ribosomal protein S19e